MPTPSISSPIGPDAPVPPEFLGRLGGGALAPNGERIAEAGPPGRLIVGERLRSQTLREAGIGGLLDGVG